MSTRTADPGDRTAYDRYVGTQVLHSLAVTRTGEPAERAFLVVSQVMELYFGLICFEWRHAQQALRTDQLPEALAALSRSVDHFAALNASWRSLHGLTPARFNRFRGELGEASGVQSAAYRHLEFLLGLKSKAQLPAHRRSPAAYVELVAAWHAPSLYDDALAVLHRCGYRVPAAVRVRRFSAPYAPAAPDAAVTERAWADLYRAEEASGSELWRLAETLVDIAEQFAQWQHRHLLAVRRSMGARPGTAGTDGLAWLAARARRPVFPELLSARTAMSEWP